MLLNYVLLENLPTLVLVRYGTSNVLTSYELVCHCQDKAMTSQDAFSLKCCLTVVRMRLIGISSLKVSVVILIISSTSLSCGRPYYSIVQFTPKNGDKPPTLLLNSALKENQVELSMPGRKLDMNNVKSVPSSAHRSRMRSEFDVDKKVALSARSKRAIVEVDGVPTYVESRAAMAEWRRAEVTMSLSALVGLIILIVLLLGLQRLCCTCVRTDDGFKCRFVVCCEDIMEGCLYDGFVETCINVLWCRVGLEQNFEDEEYVMMGSNDNQSASNNRAITNKSRVSIYSGTEPSPEFKARMKDQRKRSMGGDSTDGDEEADD